MNDQVILIVGASSMIGQACAQIFSRQGMKLMLVGRDQLKMESLVKKLAGDVKFSVTDMSLEENVQTIIKKTVKEFNRLDAVIYNVAIYPWKTIAELTLAEWKQTLDINLTGAFLTTKASCAVMKKQKSGSIIFISSLAGETLGLPHMAAYAASKAGLNGLMRTAAIEFAPYDIRVNSISPGKIYDSTHMSEEEIKNKLSPIPLQRFIKPQDIAHMAKFLLSQQAVNITGQNFIVDGGQSILGEDAHIKR